MMTSDTHRPIITLESPGRAPNGTNDNPP